MLQLAWPWLLLVLPLPWLLRRWLRPAQQPGAALRIPFGAELPAADPRRMRERRWPLWLALLAWIALLLAASRPQWLGEPLPVPMSGRDLMLAVDISESMSASDFVLGDRRVNRITAVKAVTSEFIQNRHGDRLGLILFAANAYLQAPLTIDRNAVETLLNEAFIGLAGRETAIGDAIGLAVKRLRERPAQTRVLILLTDGANTAGEVAPLKAAELAANAGIRVHTVGIGTDRGGARLGLRGTGASALDETQLRTIARVTGGQYFFAQRTEELARIYAELDRIEAVEQPEQWLRPVTELFPWPLALALLLALPPLLRASRSMNR